ncbi:MAG: hypothetical protein P9F19_15800 [Candidatus Contendobacter sp.]|nr:hypothetical protein [Candidatus Contendobacter sp.]MDG4558835.1 hypothetical protein [Candidatus Contendobacter sp.]
MVSENDSGSVPEENVTPGQNESKNDSEDAPPNPKGEGRSSFRKETLYEETISTPRSILRECLQNSFTNREDASAFCFDYCREVHKDLSDTTPFNQILIRIIEYYEVRGRERELWQWIRERNRSNYLKWFDQWEDATKRHQSRGSDASVSHGKDEAGNKVKENRIYSAFTRQVIKQVKYPNGTKEGSEDAKSSGESVLASGNREAINDWFFSELIPAERGMVLATALFQGINRHYLTTLSRDVANIFFGEHDTLLRDSQS